MSNFCSQTFLQLAGPDYRPLFASGSIKVAYESNPDYFYVMLAHSSDASHFVVFQRLSSPASPPSCMIIVHDYAILSISQNAFVQEKEKTFLFVHFEFKTNRIVK